MAQVKCWICEIKDDKTLMRKADNGKHYHEHKCYDEYIKQCEFKKEENEKWSNLYEYIKELHGVMIVPPRNIKRLHELRNGFDFKEGKKIQRYKQGVPYDLMLDSYRLCEEKIKWFIKDVLKDGKDAEDINKCITMMLNGLNTAWQQRKRKEKRDLAIAESVSSSQNPDELTVQFKKKEVTNDISDFL